MNPGSKTRKIFIDVGASFGQTCEIALNPKYGFDEIFLIEPATECMKRLNSFKSKKISIFQIALSNTNSESLLFGSGSLGASLYPDKKYWHGSLEPKIVKVLDASEFINSNFRKTDLIYLKLNCEGGEANILESLLDTNSITRIKELYVDFDIKKIPSQSHREPLIKERLKASGIVFTDPVNFIESGWNGVRFWLDLVIEIEKVSFQNYFNYRTFGYLKSKPRLKKLIKTCIPKVLKNNNTYFRSTHSYFRRLFSDY